MSNVLIVNCPGDVPDIWLELTAGSTAFHVEGMMLDRNVERSVLRDALARLHRFEDDLIEAGPIRFQGVSVQAWSYPRPLPARIVAQSAREQLGGTREFWPPHFTLNRPEPQLFTIGEDDHETATTRP